MASGYSPLRRWLRANRVREPEEQRRADIPLRRAHRGCVCSAGPCFKFPCVSSASADGQPFADDHPLNDPGFFRLRLPVESALMFVSPDQLAFLKDGTPLPPAPTECYEGQFFYDTDEPGTWDNSPGSGPLTPDHLKAAIQDLEAVARGEVKIRMPQPDPVPPWRAPKG
jgi:hypothetical protein